MHIHLMELQVTQKQLIKKVLIIPIKQRKQMSH